MTLAQQLWHRSLPVSCGSVLRNHHIKPQPPAFADSARAFGVSWRSQLVFGTSAAVEYSGVQPGMDYIRWTNAWLHPPVGRPHHRWRAGGCFLRRARPSSCSRCARMLEHCSFPARPAASRLYYTACDSLSAVCRVRRPPPLPPPLPLPPPSPLRPPPSPLPPQPPPRRRTCPRSHETMLPATAELKLGDGRMEQR